MKAQVAMEYIVTYGWALVAVMVLVAGLSFFGIFRPEDTLPEDCYISTEIECQDFRIYVNEISGNNDEEFLEVYVRNVGREDLYVSKVQCILGDNYNMTPVSDAFIPTDFDVSRGAGVLRTNRFATILCGGSGLDSEVLRSGTKAKAELILEVSTENSFPHQIRGEVIANVK